MVSRYLFLTRRKIGFHSRMPAPHQGTHTSGIDIPLLEWLCGESDIMLHNGINRPAKPFVGSLFELYVPQLRQRERFNIDPNLPLRQACAEIGIFFEQALNVGYRIFCPALA